MVVVPFIVSGEPSTRVEKWLVLVKAAENQQIERLYHNS